MQTVSHTAASAAAGPATTSTAHSRGRVELTADNFDAYFAQPNHREGREPAGEAASRNGRDMLRLPGVYSIGWRPTAAPDVLEINTYNDDAALTLDRFVEDTLVGAKLVKQRHPYIKVTPKPDPKAPGHEFSVPDSFPLMVSSVLAMPGVIDEGTGGSITNGFSSTFQATNAKVVERLDPLFRNVWTNNVTTLTMGWTTKPVSGPGGGTE